VKKNLALQRYIHQVGPDKMGFKRKAPHPSHLRSMGKTLVLVGYDGAGVSQLLDTSRTVKYVLCSQGFELCISKRNGVGDIAGFVPEPDPAKVRL
jgi:hypothetical protein